MTVSIFVSYQRSDKDWVRPGGKYNFVPWLEQSLLRRDVCFWADPKLEDQPGDIYLREIRERIVEANIALLLISQEFFNSQFIKEKELPLIRERYEKGDMHIIPVLVGPVMRDTRADFAWIYDMQMLPSPDEPLIVFTREEAEWKAIRVDIANRIQTRVESWVNKNVNKGSTPLSTREEWSSPSSSTQSPERSARQSIVQQALEDREVWATSDDEKFVGNMTDRLRSAKRVTLIGIGLNILHREPLLLNLMSRAAAGDCSLAIYLADPLSPSIEDRLIEEELGETRPSVGREGLLKRLHKLLDLWNKHGSPGAIELRVFGHYPTFALLVVDEDYFIYPYGYARLGNFSPVFRFSRESTRDGGVVDFLMEHARRVKDSSVDMRSALDSEQPDIAQLRSFAVFIVPPANSALYRFGSEILGYDVRGKEDKPARFESQVGQAREYGFHLTLCDVLYFWNDHQRKLASEQIRALARDIDRFSLTRLRIEKSFPDPESVAIAVDDATGELEALHCESVHRIYRRAAASNYSIGRANDVRDGEKQRAELMIKRYRAPYVLKRFKPHFTLLTKVARGDQPAVYQELKRLFAERVKDRSVPVDVLSIMSRDAETGRWAIDEEIKLR